MALADTPLATDPETPGLAPRLGRALKSRRVLETLIPLVTLIGFLVAWDLTVTINEIPPYLLPRPWLVVTTFVNDWPMLWAALLVTLRITFLALIAAVVGGVLTALLFAQSRWIEVALYPYAVVLQVTPIVAIAPLLIVYAPSTEVVLLLCAFLVAFFPILSNCVQGLKSADHNLMDLFELYGATKRQTLYLLKIPTAMPYFVAGLNIAGGLALIGSVVAEFTAGAAGADAGLAFRILEAGRRLNIPRLFAALLLITVTGVLIFFLTSLISRLLLRRWHESALTRER